MEKRLVHGFVGIVQIEVLAHNADANLAFAGFEPVHHRIPGVELRVAALHPHLP